MLAKDVKALAESESAPPGLRALAARLAEHYRYPVDFQIVDVEGRLYAQGEANELFRPYRSVLEEGLR